MPHHKIPRISLLLALCLGTALAYGQTNFNNPSFEGTAAPNATPPGWSACYGTPDVLPGGVWGVTLPAFGGSTYIGLVTAPGGYKEAFGQPFTFSPGVTYSFSLNLARSPIYDDAYGSSGAAGRLNVWAGTGECFTSQLIWTSPVATDTWQNHTFSFTPTTSYSYISLEVTYPAGTGDSNVLIDNLRLNCSTPTAPTATAAGTLASQNRVWQLDQPLNLLTNVTVTGVPAAEVKWAAEYRRNGQLAFTRIISNPAGYRFETADTVLLRPAYFCGGNPVSFTAPVQVVVTGGFKQKIDVNWPGAHVDILVVCEVSIKRNGLLYYKGTTSHEGKLYVEGLKNGDQILVKSSKFMKPYASATYSVTFSAEQTTPVVINLAPSFADAGL